jgi:predicted exporter
MQRLAATELGLRMDALIKQHDGGWLAYVRLTGVADEGELLRLVDSRPQWLSFLNVHQQSSQIVADYLDEALGYFYGAALIITLMLLLVHKNGYLVIKTMLPVVAAIAVSAALQVATGERLSLFHVAALLLVMGFGLDYALFSVRTPADSPLFAVTMMSLITCNISTLLVFGLLAGSEVPVLHAIGTTVSVGAFAALIFSVLMVPEGDRGGELSVARAD